MFNLFDFDIIEIESPSSDIPATKEQSTLTTSPSIFKVSYFLLLTMWVAAHHDQLMLSFDEPFASSALAETSLPNETVYQQITVRSCALPPE